jgi:hypothetical protein
MKKRTLCSLALIILLLTLVSCASPLPNSYRLETPRPDDYDFVKEHKEFLDYTFGEGNYSYTREALYATDISYLRYRYNIPYINNGKELTMLISDDPGNQTAYVLCKAVDGEINSITNDERKMLDVHKYFSEQQIETYDFWFTSQLKRIQTEYTYTADDPIISTANGVKLTEPISIEYAIKNYGYQYFINISSGKDVDSKELEREIEPLATNILDDICEYLNVENGYVEFVVFRKEGGLARQDVIYKKGKVKNAQVIVDFTLSPPRGQRH